MTTEKMYDVTVEFLTDVLTTFPAFFTSSDFDSLALILSGHTAEPYIATLKDGDFNPQALAFGRLMLAYGDAAVQELARNTGNSRSRQILRHLFELLTCSGYAGAEDEICTQALEFWATFAEYLIDSLFAAGEENTSWMDGAKQYVVEAIEASWIKIRMPPYDIGSTWDTDMRIEFKSFRADVEDFLQSSYALLGVDMFQRFARLTQDSIRNRAWLHLEATLFCLSALSDSISDDETVDNLLSNLFGSSLFADMASPEIVIPAKTRQTAVSLISHYTSFFERHTDYLPAMLNFLFVSLKAPALASVAAKAISSTCSSCRSRLIPELGAFLQQYQLLLTWDEVEASTKEKVIGAIAAIVQALSSEDAKIDPLHTLLQFVEVDVHTCASSVRTGDIENAQMNGLCALRCLVSMGKASQVPDDVAIDLDEERPLLTVWEREAGVALQSKIVQYIITVVDMMRWDSEIIEAACQVLRTGYTETTPGPFIFQPRVTEDFVIASGLNTARLSYVLDTAGAMLNSYNSESSSRVSDAAQTFLVHLLGILRDLKCE